MSLLLDFGDIVASNFAGITLSGWSTVQRPFDGRMTDPEIPRAAQTWLLLLPLGALSAPVPLIQASNRGPSSRDGESEEDGDRQNSNDTEKDCTLMRHQPPPRAPPQARPGPERRNSLGADDRQQRREQTLLLLMVPGVELDGANAQVLELLRRTSFMSQLLPEPERGSTPAWRGSALSARFAGTATWRGQ